MSLTNTEKKEIETLVRQEIRDFLDSSTIRQFEEKLLELIRKEIKNGNLSGGDIG